jgi:DNA-binding LytR/AlgR family response regulator
MENKLCFSVYGELYVVDLDRMLYFEADDHYTHVYYSSGTHFMIPFGLAKVEAALSDKWKAGDAFLRLGRKYIVNTRRVFHVNAVKQVAVLVDDGTNYTLHLPKPVLRMLMENISGKLDTMVTQR